MDQHAKKVMQVWWRVISEHGLAFEIMSEANVFPNPTKEWTYQEGDPVSLDNFNQEQLDELFIWAGGIEGMRQKLLDENAFEQLDEIDPMT